MNPKTSLVPSCLDYDNLSLSIMLMQEVACFQSMQSRGEATPRTQNVLAQGQSDAHRDSKLYNTIVEVPARLNLK